MTVAEGGGRRAITRKMQDVYVPTLKANYVLWVSWCLVPYNIMEANPSTARSADRQLQVHATAVSNRRFFLCPRRQSFRADLLSKPFVSTVGIAWTAYLSLTNASDDA